MWKDYSKSYIKNNRASSISIVAASFIAALFLSLLCSVAYNFWCYDVEAVILEEGDWQGRITGNLSDEDIETVKNFAGIKKTEINKNLSTSKETVVDLYFEHVGNAYSQMPLIIKQLGLDENAASYHTLLLSKYFVNDPSDDSPPFLLFYYAIILIIMMVSLILIIRNSFEITMDARIQQFGILSSIGATPKQIRTCLLQESAILSMIPICVGTGMGVLICFGLIAGINNFASDVAGRHEAYFQYHLIVLVITIVISLATVLISAWIPAKKLSKTTPLEAIRGTKEIKLNKVKHSRVLYALFGIEGELAGNALKAQKKSLRI